MRHHAVERLTAWVSITPPESFTYRSYLQYLLRSLPRYGIGPLLVVVYQVASDGPTRAVLFSAWFGAAVSASIVGFALARRDWAHAAAAGCGTGMICGFLYRWLPTTELGVWVLVFVGWFEVIAALVGAAAAAR